MLNKVLIFSCFAMMQLLNLNIFKNQNNVGFYYCYKVPNNITLVQRFIYN